MTHVVPMHCGDPKMLMVLNIINGNGRPKYNEIRVAYYYRFV